MTSGVAFLIFSVEMLHLGGPRPVCAWILSKKQTYSSHAGGRNAASLIALVWAGSPGESVSPYSPMLPWLTCAGADRQRGQCRCWLPEFHHQCKVDATGFHYTKNADRAEEKNLVFYENRLNILGNDSCFFFYDKNAFVPACPSNKG